MKLRNLILAAAITLQSSTAFAWKNGPTTVDLNNPGYGGHDWIAEQTVRMLPTEESAWMSRYIIDYLLGTEAPDNSKVCDKFNIPRKGYGDKRNHHFYFPSDDVGARRAQEEYAKAEKAYGQGRPGLAAFHLGAASHYIADHAVPFHTLQDEDQRIHASYENALDSSIGKNVFFTNRTDSKVFLPYIRPDGLEEKTAYNGAFIVAHKTFFGPPTALDMYMGYPGGSARDWPKEYKDRFGELISNAVNELADVLHTFYVRNVRK